MVDKILIIDDDLALAEMVATKLSFSGFDVLTASSGKEGLKEIYEYRPNLVILDVMMPEMDGWEICKRLKVALNIPVLMLTGKSSDEDTIYGFQLGADDYVKKPFDLQELEERIRAILRRTRRIEQEEVLVYDDGRLRIDLIAGQVYLDGELIHFSPIEFELFKYLVKRKGMPVSREELLKAVWGSANLDAVNSLFLYIHFLRDKIEENPREPKYIRTKWGYGYWFVDQTVREGTR